MFIPNDDERNFDGKSWDQFLAKWMELVQPQGRYRTVEVMVLALVDMNAREYVSSVHSISITYQADRLDAEDPSASREVVGAGLEPAS